MVPPKDPYIKVRVLDDMGEGILLSDKTANLARHSMHFLKRTDAEQYIARIPEVIDSYYVKRTVMVSSALNGANAIENKFDFPSSLMVDRKILPKPGSPCIEDTAVLNANIQWRDALKSRWSKVVNEYSFAARYSGMSFFFFFFFFFFMKVDVEERGKEPGHIESFAVTHKRKNGTYINQDAQQFMEVATTLMEECAGTSESSYDTSLQNEVFAELIREDQHERVKGYGL
ncbi:hypothetical protein GH714_034346 [Hevea brasiliensis]|uniref:DNA replication complex GINS protein PSF1 C-terminal domain-containing protein n=1 Tax=Hevea brasiliensis TaxID=3981 RepID=A0A6A6NAM4_HEVBR|nr:hypothetical protein GH714_034346 [Hevea brasiliensis]